jgi:hypothetical protein
VQRVEQRRDQILDGQIERELGPQDLGALAAQGFEACAVGGADAVRAVLAHLDEHRAVRVREAHLDAVAPVQELAQRRPGFPQPDQRPERVEEDSATRRKDQIVHRGRSCQRRIACEAARIAVQESTIVGRNRK